MFGSKLIGHEGVGFMLADNEMDIRMSRLSILHTAWLLDQGERGGTESSMSKVFVSEAVWRVVDRCVQVLGGQGVTGETLVARIFNEVRGFRSTMVRPRSIAGAWRNASPAMERTGERFRSDRQSLRRDRRGPRDRPRHGGGAGAPRRHRLSGRTRATLEPRSRRGGSIRT